MLQAYYCFFGKLFLAEGDWDLKTTVLASRAPEVLLDSSAAAGTCVFQTACLTGQLPCQTLYFIALQAIQQALQSAQQDNVRANARKLMIERRKEEAERRLMQAEEEAERSRMMQLKATEQAEEERRRKDM